MPEVLLILQRELLERVRTRSFLLGTLLFPAFLAGTLILPGLVGEGGKTRRIAVVDEAPPGIASRFVELLTAPPPDPDAREEAGRYTVELVPGPLEAARARLNARVRAKTLDGYVVFPADALETNRVLYRSGTILGPTALREIRDAASRALQAERLRRAGLELGEVASLLRPAEIEQTRITASGEEGGDAQATFLFAYLLSFTIYLMVALYGVGVMRSVLEEKTNRIAELLVSSVRAPRLMAGKIAGVGSAALLQVLIWAALLALLVSQSETLAARFGLQPETIRALEIAPTTAALLVAYFLLGFFLFAALFAALGAAVTSEQEAQSLQMLLMLPLFLPLFFLVALTTDPLGRTATVLGLLPFTAPIAMPMRLAAGQVPGAQVAASLALLALALAAVAWVAGKIYRVGILATGKRPGLAELRRWIRMA